MTLRGEFDGTYITFPVNMAKLSEEEEKIAIRLIEQIAIAKQKKKTRIANIMQHEFDTKYLPKIEEQMQDDSVHSTLRINGLEDEIDRLGGDIWAYMDFEEYYVDNGYLYQRLLWSGDSEDSDD